MYRTNDLQSSAIINNNPDIRLEINLMHNFTLSAGRKRSNLQQPLSRLLKLKEMYPILKALLKFIYSSKITRSPKSVWPLASKA